MLCQPLQRSSPAEGPGRQQRIGACSASATVFGISAAATDAELRRPGDDELGVAVTNRVDDLRRGLPAAGEISGSESAIANQANSSRCCPLNHALNGEPVRIRPGQTVVTAMLSLASSGVIALERPASANLLAQYGAMWGNASLPPIEEMFAMRPPPCRRMCGIAACMVCSGPQKCTAIASSKSASVACSSGRRDHAGVVHQHVDGTVPIDDRLHPTTRVARL
jgi:hypothetical protein